LRARLTPRFLIDPATGGFYRNPLGYVVGSIVEKVEGLPKDATYNGYTVHWPPFGNLILGEMVITPYMRRISLIRFTYSNGSGARDARRRHVRRSTLKDALAHPSGIVSGRSLFAAAIANRGVFRRLERSSPGELRTGAKAGRFGAQKP
jgi:hypothetical protein